MHRMVAPFIVSLMSLMQAVYFGIFEMLVVLKLAAD